jgi:hypothetical protein
VSKNLADRDDATIYVALAYSQVVGKIQEHGRAMNLERYGKPNPNAPKELSQFAFLIGEWQCEVRLKDENGEYRASSATWVCRYTLDGYALTDEFKRFGPDGELVQFGANFRSYNADKNVWVMKWYDALASTWLDLGPEELGGIQVGRASITFKHHVTGGIVRAAFLDMSENRFTWQADFSSDGGSTWDEDTYVIEAHRVVE